MVTDWRKRKVPDLCEENANSKVETTILFYCCVTNNCYDQQIQCYDAALTGKPRFCMFENVMVGALIFVSDLNLKLLSFCTDSCAL